MRVGFISVKSFGIKKIPLYGIYPFLADGGRRERDSKRVAAQHHKRYEPPDGPLGIGVMPSNSATLVADSITAPNVNAFTDAVASAPT
jgi:hypothetical protein